MSPRPALPPAVFPAAALLTLAACSDSTGPEVTDPRLFVALDAGGAHTCAIDKDRRIHCWGHNRCGKLGIPVETTLTTSPTMVAGGQSWREVSAGDWHTCAVTMEGASFCWGSNDHGQLGVRSAHSLGWLVPVPVKMW